MNSNIAAHGVIGTAAPLLGWVTSMREELLWWVQIGSVTVGLAVGVLTLISLWRNNFRK